MVQGEVPIRPHYKEEGRLEKGRKLEGSNVTQGQKNKKVINVI